MIEQRSQLGAVTPETEYRYNVRVRALEAFANLLARLGIRIIDQSSYVSFTSPRLLNMKQFEQTGLIWSYSIARVQRNEELVEEG